MAAAAVNVARSTTRSAQLVTHTTIASIRSARNALHPSSSVGFVPTMGALHEGHLSLVKQARQQNDVVVASIFVNPTQFAPGEDLDKYPRQLERDTELLADLGVDHLFTPDASTMYNKNHATYVEPQGFDDTAEGRSRPGHFRGVATIVTKLLNIVRPTNAYFGQKDAAQCVLIRRVVEDLNIETNVVVMDTVRENDGLAMSSRNAYLTPTERLAAPVVYRSLCAARELYLGLDRNVGTGDEESSASISGDELREAVESVLKSEPLVSEIQYVAVDSKVNMHPLDRVRKGDGAVVSLACKVGSVRLIDNIVL